MHSCIAAGDADRAPFAGAEASVESETERILPAALAGISIVEVVVRHSSRDPEFKDTCRLLRLSRESHGERHSRDDGHS